MKKTPVVILSTYITTSRREDTNSSPVRNVLYGENIETNLIELHIRHTLYNILCVLPALADKVWQRYGKGGKGVRGLKYQRHIPPSMRQICSYTASNVLVV